jgi:hypothetical protein
MDMKKIAVSVVAGVLLNACDGGCVTITVGSDDNSNEQNSAESGAVFDPMVDTMDRAQNAGQTSDDRKNSLDDAMREAEGN